MHGAGFAAEKFKCVWILHDIGKRVSYALRKFLGLACGRGNDCQFGPGCDLVGS